MQWAQLPLWFCIFPAYWLIFLMRPLSLKTCQDYLYSYTGFQLNKGADKLGVETENQVLLASWAISSGRILSFPWACLQLPWNLNFLPFSAHRPINTWAHRPAEAWANLGAWPHAVLWSPSITCVSLGFGFTLPSHIYVLFLPVSHSISHTLLHLLILLLACLCLGFFWNESIPLGCQSLWFTFLLFFFLFIFFQVLGTGPPASYKQAFCLWATPPTLALV